MSDQPNTGKCKSCGADILWVKMPSGKSNPLDAIPNRKGNVVIKDGLGLTVAREDKANTPPEQLFISHFATCPRAANHRKPKE